MKLHLDIVWQLEHLLLPALVQLVMLRGCLCIAVLRSILLYLLPLALLIVVVNDDDQVSLAPLLFLPLLAVIDFLGEWLVRCGLLLVSDDKLRLSGGVGNMVLLILEALLFIMISHHSLRALHTINAELPLLSPARLIDLTLQTLRVQEVLDPGIRVVCHLDQLLVIIFARF